MVAMTTMALPGVHLARQIVDSELPGNQGAVPEVLLAEDARREDSAAVEAVVGALPEASAAAAVLVASVAGVEVAENSSATPIVTCRWQPRSQMSRLAII